MVSVDTIKGQKSAIATLGKFLPELSSYTAATMKLFAVLLLLVGTVFAADEPQASCQSDKDGGCLEDDSNNLASAPPAGFGYQVHSIAGQTVLVTGASSGIGAAAVRRFVAVRVCAMCACACACVFSPGMLQSYQTHVI